MQGHWINDLSNCITDDLTTCNNSGLRQKSVYLCFIRFSLLHRNSTVARRVTNVTSEQYGDPQGYDGQDGTRGATYGLSGRCLLSWGSN